VVTKFHWSGSDLLFNPNAMMADIDVLLISGYRVHW